MFSARNRKINSKHTVFPLFSNCGRRCKGKLKAEWKPNRHRNPEWKYERNRKSKWKAKRKRKRKTLEKRKTDRKQDGNRNGRRNIPCSRSGDYKFNPLMTRVSFSLTFRYDNETPPQNIEERKGAIQEPSCIPVSADSKGA